MIIKVASIFLGFLLICARELTPFQRVGYIMLWNRLSQRLEQMRFLQKMWMEYSIINLFEKVGSTGDFETDGGKRSVF